MDVNLLKLLILIINHIFYYQDLIILNVLIIIMILCKYINQIINIIHIGSLIYLRIIIKYLISGDNGGNVIIFDFISTNKISSIYVGGIIYSLCSINENYILVGNAHKELKVIDFDNKSIIKNYKVHNWPVVGIENIKTQEKKEYIITYDENEIKLWE